MQQGSATFPYMMAGVGYPGLLLVTLLFVWRFLGSLEARSRVSLPSHAAALPSPVGAV